MDGILWGKIRITALKKISCYLINILKNCNTIYLVHKRTDMLPKVLTENLCSLVGKKERLAFSVLWEFDKDTLDIKNVKYGKSVIFNSNTNRKY